MAERVHREAAALEAKRRSLVRTPPGESPARYILGISLEAGEREPAHAEDGRKDEQQGHGEEGLGRDVDHGIIGDQVQETQAYDASKAGAGRQRGLGVYGSELDAGAFMVPSYHVS